MAILAKIQEFLDQFEILNKQLKAINFKLNQANVREGMAKMTAYYMTDHDKDIIIIDDTVLNGSYPIPIRIYLPSTESQNLPVAVFFHGGGHVGGSVAVYDNIVRKLTRQINFIIVAIDYRLAPEFPYPTGINDCKSGIKHVFNILESHKIRYRDRNLTMIGDSAGGAIAATIAMDEDFITKEQIKRQVLIYPSVDYTMVTPSWKNFASGFLLEKAKLEWYFTSYFQNNEDRKSVSPLYGAFYPSMPKTLVIVAEYDPLHDEGVLYYEKLMKIGVDAKLITVEKVLHAFLNLENLCKEECMATYEKINHFLMNK